jgi:hypothetical protein
MCAYWGLDITGQTWGTHKRRVDIREVFNGLMYILSTGCYPH